MHLYLHIMLFPIETSKSIRKKERTSKKKNWKLKVLNNLHSETLRKEEY